MFGGAIEGKATLGAPEVEAMAREMGPIPQADALQYSKGLARKEAKAKNGCYVVYCVRPCKFPVGCFYNCSCGDCMWPGIGTLPFGCFYILNMLSQRDHHYTNAKGDTLVVKVDKENQTLVCYSNGASGGPCCYCIKNC